MTENLQQRKSEWEQTVLNKTLGKFPERKAQFTTSSDIPLDRFYVPEDADADQLPGDVGFPGEYPFTRGVQPTMYRGRLLDDAPVCRVMPPPKNRTRATAICSTQGKPG